MSLVIVFCVVVLLLIGVNYPVMQAAEEGWGKLVWSGAILALLITPLVFYFSLVIVATYEKNGFAGAFAGLAMGGLVFCNGIVLIVMGLLRRYKQGKRQVS